MNIYTDKRTDSIILFTFIEIYLYIYIISSLLFKFNQNICAFLLLLYIMMLYSFINILNFI